MRVWRLGFLPNPCEFLPREFCHWNNRFDDPLKEYRTLYCADQRITCLREVFHDLRPEPKVRKEYETIFGFDPTLPVKGIITSTQLINRALARATIVTLASSRLIDVEDVNVRHTLEKENASLLLKHRIKHLDIDVVRGKDRHLTRALSRAIFCRTQWASAGISFRSNLDSARCYALFEGRSHLAQIGSPDILDETTPELIQVCQEYDLELRLN